MTHTERLLQQLRGPETDLLHHEAADKIERLEAVLVALIKLEQGTLTKDFLDKALACANLPQPSPNDR